MPHTSCFDHPESVAAVWAGIRPERDFAHRAAGVRGCPRDAAAAQRMLRGAPVPASCRTCYDTLVDTLLHLDATGRWATAANPGGYARRIAHNLMVDRLRKENTRLHGVAKPERTTGTIGAIRQALADTDGDTDTAGWLDLLLTLVLAAACARAPLGGEVWPYDRFAAAKAQRCERTDLTALRREVVGDVRLVLATIDRVAGRAWRADHVDAPLRARAAAFTDLRVGERPGGGEPVDPPAQLPEPDTGADLLRARFYAALADHSPTEAARVAAVALGGPAPSAAATRAMAFGWLLDLLALPPRRPHDAAGVRATMARLCGPAAASRMPAALVTELAATAVSLDERRAAA